MRYLRPWYACLARLLECRSDSVLMFSGYYLNSGSCTGSSFPLHPSFQLCFFHRVHVFLSALNGFVRSLPHDRLLRGRHAAAEQLPNGIRGPDRKLQTQPVHVHAWILWKQRHRMHRLTSARARVVIPIALMLILLDFSVCG